MLKNLINILGANWVLAFKKKDRIEFVKQH